MPHNFVEIERRLKGLPEKPQDELGSIENALEKGIEVFCKDFLSGAKVFQLSLR